MSRDFEVGRNVSCEESTISPVRANLLIMMMIITGGQRIWTKGHIAILSPLVAAN